MGSARDHQVIGTAVFSAAADVPGGRRPEVVVHPNAGYGGAWAIKTRQANATPYAAGAAVGDAAGAIWQFDNMGPAGSVVVLLGAALRIDVSAVPAGMANHRFELYDAAPAAIADGAVWDLNGPDRAKYLGDLTIGAMVDKGSVLYSRIDGEHKPVRLADGSSSLWAVLVTEGGHVPGSAAVIAARLCTAGI